MLIRIGACVRHRHYIKERTKNAQFIIISLRNNMFELADRLVGIYKTDNCTKTVTINPHAMAGTSVVRVFLPCHVGIGLPRGPCPSWKRSWFASVVFKFLCTHVLLAVMAVLGVAVCCVLSSERAMCCGSFQEWPHLPRPQRHLLRPSRCECQHSVFSSACACVLRPSHGSMYFLYPCSNQVPHCGYLCVAATTQVHPAAARPTPMRALASSENSAV